MKKIPISKEELTDLYWNKHLKPKEIAKMFGIKNERTIRKKMEKYGIKRKTVSEALTRKLKKPFLGNLTEKAYLLGLRAGDFHAKKVRKCIRIQTSTTHLAQIDLLRNSFKEYSQICTYRFRPKEKERKDEWFIYVDLHHSFDFLLEKPMNIPKWIIEDNASFLNFLAAYVDCEGNWHLSKSHDKHLRFTFRLRTSDKEILENIKSKFEYFGLKPIFYIERKKGEFLGYGAYTNDFYALILNKKSDVVRLIEYLLPLSRHSEKVRKMEFMLENRKNSFKWPIDKWNNLRKEIKKEILGSQEKRSQN
ncbi:MAG: hypothetical protein NT001_00815 [Candidatus Woesearchaeota archaeon]|nr:hypothetical protein [Candidatus Woesearchaeota archaeon]